MKSVGLVQVCLGRIVKVMATSTAPAIGSSRTLPHPLLLTSRSRSAMASATFDSFNQEEISSPVSASASVSVSASASASASAFPSYGDPCLDLFFNVRLPYTIFQIDGTREELEDDDDSATINYLKQLLPVAWSHDPLTTLKLICNLNTTPTYPKGKRYPRALYTAAVWLHYNHPKTLLCNLPSIAADDSYSSLDSLLQIPYHLLQQGVGQDDPAYKSLHDLAMDQFAGYLLSDIEKMKQGKLRLKPSDFSTDDDDDGDSYLDDVARIFKVEDRDANLDADAFADRFVSPAASFFHSKCPTDIHIRRTVSLLESMAKRLLPPDPQSRERFHEELLTPLHKYWNRQYLRNGRKPCPLRKHLEQVKAAAVAGTNPAVNKPDALLPHEIITFAQTADLWKAAELQWKAMVDMYRKQSKFKNCLAVCNVNREMDDNWKLQIGLGLLLSQLSEDEAWKGKVMCFYPPDSSQDHHDQLLLLHSVQGHDTLWSKWQSMRRTSKCEFLRDSSRNSLILPDINKVVDLILEVAAKENLKPEQMIKKVFVFTNFPQAIDGSFWYPLYEANQSKFKEKGYGDDAMPHIFVWNMFEFDLNSPSMPPTQHPGMTLLNGMSYNLIKFFFDNGGDIALRHLMETAIQEYRSLSVVD